MRIPLMFIFSIVLLSCSAGHVWVLECSPVASDSTSTSNILAHIDEVAAEHGFARREGMTSQGEIIYTHRADNMGTIFMCVPSAYSYAIQVRLYEYPIIGKHGSTSTNVFNSLVAALREIPTCQVSVTNIVH